ncbi:hypothetical protein MALG_01655 [Marinovum algicola DG 898]|nr:hypothetical protein MALG_01655 [Marinovum algicola DG 898]
MSQVLEQLNRVHAARKMVAVEVPEYGWTLHFPPLTVADRQAIRRGVNPNDDSELMINGLIRMARNADGTPFFENTPQMRAALNQVDFAVLMRISAESGGTALSGEIEAEFGAVEAEALRDALVSAVGDAPALKKVLAKASEGDLLVALRSLLQAVSAPLPSKNG